MMICSTITSATLWWMLDMDIDRFGCRYSLLRFRAAAAFVLYRGFTGSDRLWRGTNRVYLPSVLSVRRDGSIIGGSAGNGWSYRSDAHLRPRYLRIPPVLDLYHLPDSGVPYSCMPLSILSNLMDHNIYHYNYRILPLISEICEQLRKRDSVMLSLFYVSCSEKSSLERGLASAAIFSSVFSIWV